MLPSSRCAEQAWLPGDADTSVKNYDCARSSLASLMCRRFWYRVGDGNTFSRLYSFMSPHAPGERRVQGPRACLLPTSCTAHTRSPA